MVSGDGRAGGRSGGDRGAEAGRGGGALRGGDGVVGGPGVADVDVRRLRGVDGAHVGVSLQWVGALHPSVQ